MNEAFLASHSCAEVILFSASNAVWLRICNNGFQKNHLLFTEMML